MQDGGFKNMPKKFDQTYLVAQQFRFAGCKFPIVLSLATLLIRPLNLTSDFKKTISPNSTSCKWCTFVEVSNFLISCLNKFKADSI